MVWYDGTVPTTTALSKNRKQMRISHLKPVYRLLILGCLIGLLGLSSLYMGLAARFRMPVQLVQMSLPAIVSRSCPTSKTGFALEFLSEWILPNDPVSVLTTLQQRGWEPITHMTTDIKLLPGAPMAVDLGLGQVGMSRGVELAYAGKQMTRLKASTGVVVCLP